MSFCKNLLESQIYVKNHEQVQAKASLIIWLKKDVFNFFSGIFSLRTLLGVFFGAEPEFYTQNVFRDTFDKN